jgi:hypothetical protein
MHFRAVAHTTAEALTAYLRSTGVRAIVDWLFIRVQNSKRRYALFVLIVRLQSVFSPTN